MNAYFDSQMYNITGFKDCITRRHMINSHERKCYHKLCCVWSLRLC